MARRPFFGQNDTKIAKMDMQAATAPGRAYAAAFQKLGDVASDTLEKFREKKEEKAQQELSKNQIVNLYKGNPDHPVFKALDVQSIDEAKAVAGDFSKQPELLTQAMSFAKAVTDEKQAQEASQLRDLQRQQLQQSMEGQKADRLRADEEREQSQTQSQNLNRFLQTGGSELLQSDQGQSLYNRMVKSGVDPVNALKNVQAFEQRIAQSQPKAPSDKELEELLKLRLANQKALKESELPVLTEGEQVIDELVAKEYTEYVNLGGKSAVQSKIKKLNKAIQDLEGSDDLNSWLTGVLPESMKALFNEKGLSVQQAVESVIQENLRETLGAQFAQKEGEMFMARGYDAKLSDEVNIERVKSLLKEIEDRASARTQTFDYFNKNKTMKGYDGPVFNESSQPSSSSSFDPQEIDRLYEEKMRLGKARGLR